MRDAEGIQKQLAAAVEQKYLASCELCRKRLGQSDTSLE